MLMIKQRPGTNPAPPVGLKPKPPPPPPTLKMSAEAKALNRIADAIEKQAAATMLLARATAGEFDDPDQVSDPVSPGQGMGMRG